MTDDADDIVTGAELAAARERWADPDRKPLKELFAGSVEADGLLGDVPIRAVGDGLPPGVSEGDSVTAKRLGWDDGPEDDDPDRTPYDEMDYASAELSGLLTAVNFTLPDGTPGIGWELGGQPADPTTVRLVTP